MTTSQIIDDNKKLPKQPKNNTSVLFLLSAIIWISVFVVNTSVFLLCTLIRSLGWYHFDIKIIQHIQQLFNSIFNKLLKTYKSKIISNITIPYKYNIIYLCKNLHSKIIAHSFHLTSYPTNLLYFTTLKFYNPIKLL